MLRRIYNLAFMLSVFTFGKAQNNLYLSNAKIDIGDSTATMDVKAELFSAIDGFQFELDYDSKVAKVDTIIASSELSNFTLSFNRMLNGKTKVIAISFSGAKIDEGLVDLGKVVFKVNPSLIRYSQVRLYDPVVSINSKSESIYPYPGYILHPDQSFVTVDRLDSEWMLNLSSSQDLSGLQFTFNYDRKIASIDSIKLNSDLLGDKSLAWNEPESGKVKMVVNSLTNATIASGLSSLLSVYRTNLIPMNFSRLSSSDERTGANLVVYNDDIYVVGGTKNNSLRKYDAQSNSWSLVESEIYPRQWSTAEVIENKIYMLGGRDFVNYNIVKNQSYDFSTRVVKDLADMPYPVKYHGSVAHNGMLYVIGGSKPGPDYLDNLQRYDPSADSWTQLSPLPTKRHTDAVVHKNKIYAVGGYNHNVGDYKYIDVYNIDTDSWESSITMPINVSAHRLALYEDFIFIVSDYDDHLGKIFAYNISNDSWKNYSSNFTPRRHVASIINGQKLYTYGGNYPTTDSTNAERNYFEVSDIVTKANSSISDFAFSEEVGVKSDGSTHSVIGLNSYHIDTNSPPMISEIPDTSLNEDSAISLPLNAVDKEGDQIVFSVESNNDNILANLSADVLILTPRENWSGSAVIKISASDGNTSSFITFIVTVNPVNDAPYFTSTPNNNVIVDNNYEYKLTAYDVDDNKDSLTYALYLLPSWLSYDSASHILSGKPDTTVLGKDSVSVSVSDGKITTFQNFSIKVLPSNYDNQPPVFSTVPITAVSQDLKYNYTALANDADNDTLNYQVIAKPSWLSVINDTILTGTPKNQDVGFHEVSIVVKDGYYVVKQDFKIEVKDINDAPRFSTSPVTAAQEDSLYSYTFGGIDPDDDSLTFQVPGIPSWLTFDGSSTISGTPREQDVGEYPIIVVMSDGFINVNQAFFITVKNTNDAPAFITSPKTRAIASKKYEYVASAIDPDLGATLSTYNAKIETYPAWLNENSIVSAEGGELNITLKGTPSSDDEGSKFPVVISVTDRIDTTYQRFSIEVSSENYVNASPVFASQPSEVAYEDSIYTYSIYAKDDDTSDTLEVSVKKHPAWLTFDGDTTLYGTPDQEDIGSDSVIIAVTDGFEVVTQHYALTVLASNDPPTFTSSPTKVVYEDSTYTYSMSASDPDSENSLIIFVPRKLPSFLVFDGKNTVSGKPLNSDVGEHEVLLSVSDGVDASDQSFVLKVVNTNDPPTISAIEDIVMPEDSSFQMLISADDIDGDTLVFGASANISQMYFNFSGNTLTFSPAEDWFGSTFVTVFANDGYLSSSTDFNVSVKPTQDAPKPFVWISPKTDSIFVDRSNFENFYNLKWEESKDVDGEEVVYSIFAKIGIMNSEHIADTNANQLDLSYQEIIDNVFRELPIPKAKVSFKVVASDGIDTVSISGEDRVLIVDRRDYLSTKNEAMPDKFALHENFPNPFNPNTTINYDLPMDAFVNIVVYDMLGREVRILVGENQKAGFHSKVWDSRNKEGMTVSAGTYFYQIRSEGFIKTRKMILLK